MIDLKKEERCTIVGLKMSHSGNSEELEELEKLIENLKLECYKVVLKESEIMMLKSKLV